jgi:hypothetical protein
MIFCFKIGNITGSSSKGLERNKNTDLGFMFAL